MHRTVIAAVTACCFLMSGCKQTRTHSTDPANYCVITIAPVDRILSNSYPASIQGRQDIAIYPQVSGTISKVNVKEGERVSKGQTLFIIDQVPFKAALSMAEANVAAANAGVATAQLIYDSRSALYNEGVISDFDLQSAGNQLLTAKAQLAQAEAQLINASNDLSYTTVKSPSNGVVGTLPFREGSLVAPSLAAPLTTVSDNSKMFVYFSLTENQLLELTQMYGSMQQALGSMPQVMLKLSNGSLYGEQGRIETISGVIDQSTGSVSAKAVFDNRGGILHSGASGWVVLPRRMDSCIVIPCPVTFEIQDKVFAYKVVEGKAMATEIDVMLSDDGKEYIVTAGLVPGDVIVAEGVGMLREGDQIIMKNEQIQE